MLTCGNQPNYVDTLIYKAKCINYKSIKHFYVKMQICRFICRLKLYLSLSLENKPTT